MTTASNSRVLRTIPLLIAFCLVNMPAQAQYGGGTGEPNNPYQIATAEDLNDIGNHEEDWDKCFILVNDIDLSAYTGTQFNIIGRWFWWSRPDNKAFSGVFDGDGKVIRNFTWSSVDRNMVALFAFLGRNANGPTVKNLGLENVNIRAEDGAYIGALVAHNEGGLANCYVTGYVSGENDMGGLVGRNFGEIINCHSFATVEGNNDVVGLVGSNGGNIDLSFSHSTVSGRARVGGLVGNMWESLRYSFSNSTVTGDSSVGGLVGVNHPDSRTVDCYARGSVTGTTLVGGLAGANYESEDSGPGLIQRCYSSATVRGEGEHIGGLVGWNEADIISCFWDRQASGMDNMCGEERYIGIGCDDSRGKTTAEMQTARTFFSWSQCDLEVTWTIDEGNDYPRLWWENQPGDPFPARLSGLLPGSGTEDDPYLIYTAEELNLVGLFTCDFDRYFKLMADIDLTRYVGDEFNIIGIDYRYAFTGVFDGNGKRISNFTHTSMDRDNIGLFGYVDSRKNDVVIKDLGLIDPNIDAPTADRVGALVGHLEDGTLSNCYVRGGTVLGDDYVGGLVGSNGGSITTSYSNSVVSGDSRVGGLAGWNYNIGKIAMSYSTGTVSGTDWGIGGLVGQNWGGSSITTSYSTGAVSGYRSVGGLVGRNSRYGSIATSFSTGTVTGNEDVGGFVGRNQGESAVVSTCFWDTETSGLLNMCGSQDEDATGCDDSYGKTTAEMQTATTFLEAGWDFVDETVNGPNDIWKISEGLDYPHLWWEKYSGGSGEPNEPYLIYTAEQMNQIGLHEEDWDKHFKLMADIDLSSYTGTAFNIIGECYYYDARLVKNPFTGVFDGNGKRISNFSYTYTDTDDVGLFGYVEGENAEIKDLGLIDPIVDVGAGSRVGSLVGFLEEATISNCYVQGGSVSGNQEVGGLVGLNNDTITNCYANVNVTGNQDVGGLVGDNDDGRITNCYASGSVSGSGHGGVGGLVGENNGIITSCYSTGSASGDSRVGGLVGDNYGTITNCYATGSISGNDYVGGLVGHNDNTITNCYAMGSISGNNWVGGLVGENYEGAVTFSFWDTETSGQIAITGGTGKTTAEMQTKNTFTDAGWDFVDETDNGTEDIWWILEGQDYPRLWWEIGDESSP